MSIIVEVAQADGTVTLVETSFDDLGAAAAFALRLAHDLGRTATPFSQGGGLARAVIVRQEGAAELEIAVFAGGLLPAPPFEGELRLPTDR